jgi:hypothetical protein
LAGLHRLFPWFRVLLEKHIMTLLHTLFRRASIPATRMDAEAYLARRAFDNKALGDITKLEYTVCKPINGKWFITGKTSEKEPRVFNSEAEARADILRRYW